MRLYPAIDMIDGKSVRLVQGDYNKKTVFNEKPLETALNWQNLGGEFIHIVDLDGARSGSMKNFDIICKIANTLNVPIEVGGGIRSMDAVSYPHLTLTQHFAKLFREVTESGNYS